MKKFLVKILLTILTKLLKEISPQLRESFLKQIKSLEEVAAKSANPFDDLLVEALEKILGVVK